jgi:oxygen-independent coproporphyrinogen III oxidase
MREIGLYVHIPFCESKCLYCKFVSFCNKNDEQEKYFNYLINEIKIRSKFLDNSFLVTTIFIGGGTPSFVDKKYITMIMETIRKCFNISKDAEITIESNPNSINYEKAKCYFDLGINRLSMGVQSMNNLELKALGRIHNSKQVKIALNNIKKAGFTNINCDLLIGIPYQTIFSIHNSIGALIKEGITHISCYNLILEEGTPLYKMVKNEQISVPNDDKNVKFYDFVKKMLYKHHFMRYEVSNFAKSGYECKHNINYWNCGEYLGFGIAANSYINNERTENYNDFISYYGALDSSMLPFSYKEDLTPNQKLEEYVMLGLRRTCGISISKLKDYFNYDLLNIKEKEVKQLLDLKLIVIYGDSLKATEQGFYILNQIILALL